jgi:nucleotide-binding universal stress UspA family protein
MFTHILVPLDGSAYAEGAIEPARSLAEKYDARITLLTVIMEFPESIVQQPIPDQHSETRGRQYLEDVRATKLGGVSVPVDIQVTRGMPAESIAEVALASQADLIVMSTHGTGSTMPIRHTLGSIAWKILRDAPCHVLLIVAHRPLTTG